MSRRKEESFCKFCCTPINGKDKRFYSDHCRQEWEALSGDPLFAVARQKEWPRAMVVIKPLAQHDRDPGVSHQAIAQWQKCPVLRALEIERLTGVPKEMRRPDIYPPH